MGTNVMESPFTLIPRPSMGSSDAAVYSSLGMGASLQDTAFAQAARDFRVWAMNVRRACRGMLAQRQGPDIH